MKADDGTKDAASRSPAPLPPAAQRALAEARERRAAETERAEPAPREIGGRGGLDPTRYGDWESRGVVSDF